MHGPPVVRVAAVMLTFNQCETTLRALASLMPQAGPADRVIVWDNGSVDGTVEAVRAAYPDVLAHHQQHTQSAGAEPQQLRPRHRHLEGGDRRRVQPVQHPFPLRRDRGTR